MAWQLRAPAALPEDLNSVLTTSDFGSRASGTPLLIHTVPAYMWHSLSFTYNAHINKNNKNKSLKKTVVFKSSSSDAFHHSVDT